ncbi:unnamed protein product [Prorocentrum cordatum]|uniref:Tubulin-specific chaperone A n=1 Tax=Prorocentrum cordatum TaxID=2364126 RepID=A0ABN9UHI6_9DINO|nr:unnamed protein product [Polarella glacialis]
MPRRARAPASSTLSGRRRRTPAGRTFVVGGCMEDLAATTNKLEQGMADIRTAVSLMDSEVKKLEAIHPMCVDNGMSYEERVEKRKAEMEALTRALCILDTNNVEERCIA